MNNKDTESPETVCAHCAVPIFRIAGDSQSWAHLGTGQARCSILATPRVDPPAAPDEAAAPSDAWRQWFAQVGEAATVNVVNATATLVIAERAIVSPADEADKALAAETVRDWMAEHFGPPPDDMQGINEDLANRIAAALTTLRQQVAEAERRRLALVIQSLPATAAGAGTFKESVLKALEAARDGREGKQER